MHIDGTKTSNLPGAHVFLHVSFRAAVIFVI